MVMVMVDHDGHGLANISGFGIFLQKIIISAVDYHRHLSQS